VLLAFAVAVVAAVRGVWSPCGLSMLSTITPIGERGRGNEYGRTAVWYVVGGTFGGLSFGAVMAVPASVVARATVPHSTRAALVAVAALVAAASDARLGGLELPLHRRQVNERWLDRYRPWVYGAGFGWQIGTGLCTYIMTSAIYLLVVLAALTGSPAAAIGAGGVFGLIRGLAVLLGRHVRHPDALRALHDRLQATGPRMRDLVIAAEIGAAVTAAASFSVIGAAAAAIMGVGTFAATRRQRRSPACALDADRTGMVRPSSATR
jgi:hypothetical protein